MERHLTLDRAIWEADQAASIEPHGLTYLVKGIRSIEISLGDGIKKVYRNERKIISKIRKK